MSAAIACVGLWLDAAAGRAGPGLEGCRGAGHRRAGSRRAKRACPRCSKHERGKSTFRDSVSPGRAALNSGRVQRVPDCGTKSRHEVRVVL